MTESALHARCEWAGRARLGAAVIDPYHIMEKVEGGKHAEAFDISALPAKPKRNSCRWGWLDTRKLQIVGLCMVILITWGLLCLPVVFYHQRTREVTVCVCVCGAAIGRVDSTQLG